MAQSGSRPDIAKEEKNSTFKRGKQTQKEKEKAKNAVGTTQDMKSISSSKSPKGSPRKGKKSGSSTNNGGIAVEMGIKSMEQHGDNFVVETVEILKRPGQSLGFYIREGNGYDKPEGVFISRIAPGSIVESNGLLRIGDEILTVNAVNVSRMSLDDVVILMSIPKRLVLTIRTNKSPGSKNASCPSLSNLQVEDEPPVVVLKNRGRSNSSSAVEMTEKCPDEFILAGSGVNMKYYSEYSSTYGYKSHPKSTCPPYKGFTIGPYADDSGDSGLSSENSGCSAQCGKDGQSPGLTPQEKQHDVLDIKTYEVDIGRYSPRLSPRDHVGVTFHSPVVTRKTNPYVHLDYASDTDTKYSHEIARNTDAVNINVPLRQIPKVCDTHSIKAFQDEIERTHYQYQTLGGMKRHLRARNLSPDQYNSDSEVPSSAYHIHRVEAPKGPHIARLLDTDDRCNSLPQIDASVSSEELKLWLKKFDNLSFDAKEPVYTQHGDPSKGCIPGIAGGKPVKDTFTAEEYQSWLRTLNANTNPNVVSGMAGPNMRPDLTFPRQSSASHNSQNTSNHARVARKQSSESLADYRTYQLDSNDQGSTDARYGLLASNTYSKHGKHQRSLSGNLSDGGYSGNNAPGPNMIGGGNRPRYPTDSEGKTMPSPATRLKDLQLARKPLQIRTEDFTPFEIENEDSNTNTTTRQEPAKLSEHKYYNGLLHLQLFCGHGLKSSRTVLRDLYCVIEVDGVNKARTMIRTGAINFDWDESFDLDLDNARELSFHVYSWDPSTRHRLCFSTTVALCALLQQGNLQKIALRMEPKGTLYLSLDYQESAITLQRTPSARRNAQFGVDLEAIIKRDKCQDNIPHLLRKCVEEVERRGLEHVGIYRLCGSAKRKEMMKEDFEKNPRSADVSSDNVSDINVITGIIKDFLRELPEPLFTNSLYQMLVDALNVRMPGDPDGSAKLMLSILECLPKTNQDCLAYLLDHLKRVALKNDVNKMTTTNLAVCFGPVLLCPSPQSSAGVMQNAMDFKKHIQLLKYLLDIWPVDRDTGQLQLPQSYPIDPRKVATQPRRSRQDITSQNVMRSYSTGRVVKKHGNQPHRGQIANYHTQQKQSYIPNQPGQSSLPNRTTGGRDGANLLYNPEDNSYAVVSAAGSNTRVWLPPRQEQLQQQQLQSQSHSNTSSPVSTTTSTDTYEDYQTETATTQQQAPVGTFRKVHDKF